jgi:hypothetical protein
MFLFDSLLLNFHQFPFNITFTLSHDFQSSFSIYQILHSNFANNVITLFSDVISFVVTLVDSSKFSVKYRHKNLLFSLSIFGSFTHCDSHHLFVKFINSSEFHQFVSYSMVFVVEFLKQRMGVQYFGSFILARDTLSALTDML